MDFDFLPKLPKSDLDDRSFDDLVEECILRIPRYCPEWTNHNPGDPGITLIELFSWLTDQMLMRFNQVPRRNYVAFLELLGIRLQPPAPAWCELTFYLTQAQREPIRIPDSTEVATVRTETQEAIIFSTERELVIGNPKISHFLTGYTAEDRPQNLRERSSRNNEWWNLEETLLFEESTPGNCFYLVLQEDPESPIIGNVIAITFRGEAARTTGINPDDPPLRWEAWNGQTWQPTILREREHDKTKGFSFSEVGQLGTNPLIDGADVVLHLPQQWPSHDFGTEYRGHWIRCVYTNPRELQPSYSSSPSIVGINVRSIGGAVNASECIRIEEEFLGVSDGKPGQSFQLQGKPVLERKSGEHIRVIPINGQPKDWKEVADFADSGPEDEHYTIDSQTGTIQFGPLIREPAQLKQRTRERSQIQPAGRIVRRDSTETRNLSNIQPYATDNFNEALERQYGKVPPPGAEIYMVAYRTGGGSRGNVQAEKLTVIKQAIPYVKSVINYHAAIGGIDPESLDEAVIRVPQILRTRESAVTPEDFENVAKKASRSVDRAHCLTDPINAAPGRVTLLIVPQVNTDTIDFRQGMNPDRYFKLNSQLETTIMEYMQDRKPLGVQVKLQEPEYIGVSVRTEVIIDRNYNNPRAQEQIRNQLLVTLYRFLNPLTGGIEGKGWDLGRPVYPSDIVALCQKIPGVRYLGMVELFDLRKYGEEWFREDTPQSIINPGSLGLLCSWAKPENSQLNSGHNIQFFD
jgi:predicted phage baseplate assembly protein